MTEVTDEMVEAMARAIHEKDQQQQLLRVASSA